MGIGIILLVYALVLGALAVAGSIVLVFAAFRLTRPGQNGRKRAITLAAIFPYACFVWAGLCFVGYTAGNWHFFHRDPSIGDTWETRLPNGYGLMMIDLTDQGTVYNPATQPLDGSVSSQPDARFGVRRLQVVGPLIYCAVDKDYFANIGEESTAENEFVILDTSKGTQRELASEAEMSAQAAQNGTVLHLEPILTVYSRYRSGWFDIAALILLAALPIAGFVLLARFAWKVRRGELRLLFTIPPEGPKPVTGSLIS